MTYSSWIHGQRYLEDERVSGYLPTLPREPEPPLVIPPLQLPQSSPPRSTTRSSTSYSPSYSSTTGSPGVPDPNDAGTLEGPGTSGDRTTSQGQQPRGDVLPSRAVLARAAYVFANSIIPVDYPNPPTDAIIVIITNSQSRWRYFKFTFIHFLFTLFFFHDGVPRCARSPRRWNL
mgnify:CR=1 FL=1